MFSPCPSCVLSVTIPFADHDLSMCTLCSSACDPCLSHAQPCMCYMSTSCAVRAHRVCCAHTISVLLCALHAHPMCSLSTPTLSRVCCVCALCHPMSVTCALQADPVWALCALRAHPVCAACVFRARPGVYLQQAALPRGQLLQLGQLTGDQGQPGKSLHGARCPLR